MTSFLLTGHLVLSKPRIDRSTDSGFEVNDRNVTYDTALPTTTFDIWCEIQIRHRLNSSAQDNVVVKVLASVFAPTNDTIRLLALDYDVLSEDPTSDAFRYGALFREVPTVILVGCVVDLSASIGPYGDTGCVVEIKDDSLPLKPTFLVQCVLAPHLQRSINLAIGSLIEIIGRVQTVCYASGHIAIYGTYARVLTEPSYRPVSGHAAGAHILPDTIPHPVSSTRHSDAIDNSRITAEQASRYTSCTRRVNPFLSTAIHRRNASDDRGRNYHARRDENEPP